MRMTVDKYFLVWHANELFKTAAVCGLTSDNIEKTIRETSESNIGVIMV